MKKIPLIKSLAFFVSLFCAVGFGYGQSIWTNPITGTNPHLSNPYTTGDVPDSNITVSGIGRGAGLSLPATTNDRYNARNWNLTNIDSNDFYEFTLSPKSGYKINFSNFQYTYRHSASGPTNIAIKSSLDNFTNNIGAPTMDPAADVAISGNVSLASVDFQNITTPITFKIYAWGGSDTNGTFSINDFTFNGVVSAIPCFNTTTWTAGAWDNGDPDLNTNAVISDSYDTGLFGSFSACSLTVDSGVLLFIQDETYVEVQNDVTVLGEIAVQSKGAFVQIDDAAIFDSSAGAASVFKQTAWKSKWYYYTYWSSPVVGATIGGVFPDVDGDRRFWFNADNFIDNIGNDDIDDAAPYDWQYAYAGDPMTPGKGFAVTESRAFPAGGAIGSRTFEGAFNTGNVDVNITFDPSNLGARWNFIGNPYPSAIDFDKFYEANKTAVTGFAYYWSQVTPPSSVNAGNQQLNFSNNDYAIYAYGVGATETKPGGAGVVPDQYVPSGQGFFIPASNIGGTATFTNAMRVKGTTDNSQFFKTVGTKSKTSTVHTNKMWVNLTSNNGVFGQILIGYVPGATDAYDVTAFDAPRASSEIPATLSWLIDGSDKKFVIQGKDVNSINTDEVIKLSFKNSINTTTEYTISISKLEGYFVASNTIYLRDNLLNKTHNLSASDYTFTSAVGEFNNRFVIQFNDKALSVDEVTVSNNSIQIIELNDDHIQFNSSNNLNIKTVSIFDMLGRQLYNFKGESASETYSLSNLNNSIFIAKVTLENGAVITKKAFKK
ncbi:T9SS type A sorting domain-containing protein [Mariniflexile sp.]|uniref:T9SS type A sorting domain-containing protein n=1 Tax=Mariniflexile sp. TaxID=1979402 RepID=UPI00356467B7